MLRCAVPAIVLLACGCSLALEGRYTAAADPDAGPPATTYQTDASVPADASDDAAPSLVTTPDAAPGGGDAARPDAAPPFTCPPGAQHEHEPNDSTEAPDTLKAGLFCGEVSTGDQDVLRVALPQNATFEVKVEAPVEVFSLLLDGTSTTMANGTTVFGGNAEDAPVYVQLTSGGPGPYPYRVTLTIK